MLNEITYNNVTPALTV